MNTLRGIFSAGVMPLLLAAASPVQAVDLAWSGFGTFGYARSDAPVNYQRFIDEKGTFKRDSILGAQVDARFSQQWGATAQVKLAPSDHDDAQWQASLDVVGHGLHAPGADGITAFVAKPFEPDVLRDMLLRFWRADQTRGGGVQPLPPVSPDAAWARGLAASGEIDSAVLLRRFAGREAFLRRALRRFAGDCRTWSATLAAHLAAGDIETARRQAHSLKGLAGTFAMPGLHAALGGLESAPAEGRDGGAMQAEVEQRLSALRGNGFRDRAASGICRPSAA